MEVKTSGRIDAGDLAHLHAFCDGHHAPFGGVIHGGAEVYLASPRVVAIPYT